SAQPPRLLANVTCVTQGGRESLHDAPPSARNSRTLIGHAESLHSSSAHGECEKKHRLRYAFATRTIKIDMECLVRAAKGPDDDDRDPDDRRAEDVPGAGAAQARRF